MADEVLTQRDGAVLTITFNRPDVYNAFNRALHAALHEALTEAADPADPLRRRHRRRQGVLRGAGPEGVPVAAPARSATPSKTPTTRTSGSCARSRSRCVAAVNGAAAGAGLSFACACDVRVAADNASFVPGFIGIGLVPDAGGSWFIHRLLGFARAFEWMTSNRRLSAQEALDWGLVSEVIPADAFARRVAELAQRWAALPDARRRADEAALRARAHGRPRGAARTRGGAAGRGDADRGLRGRGRGLPGEAATELQRLVRRLPPTSEGVHDVRAARPRAGEAASSDPPRRHRRPRAQPPHRLLPAVAGDPASRSGWRCGRSPRSSP